MRTPLRGLPLLLLTLSCGSQAPSSTPEPRYEEKDRAAEGSRLLGDADWYRHAVFYEVNVRSFQDSDGDGLGDLRGLTSRLDELKALGVDALWLMPIFTTPFADSGYDVADYQNVDPVYGTLADLDALLAAAHERGMRVMLDLVLNHTSDRHEWFRESRSSKDNPKADWYVWSDTPGREDIGCGTANPTFGDQAWTLDETRNQYYFHRFYAGQPDLNYRNPEVVEATLAAAKFWLDRGVDGFRCDVIALLVESKESCEFLPETQAYVRKLRALLDSYGGRVMVAESTRFDDASSYYGNGGDMFHMAFNFTYGYFWGISFLRPLASNVSSPFESAQQRNPAGAQEALVIGSHDVGRAHTAAQGVESRWRRAAFVQMTMPGTPFIYNGEELALRAGTQTVVDFRDSARTPMLWSPGPGYGFTTGTPWLAFGAEADTTNLEVAKADPASTYSFYRELLSVRRGRGAFGSGSLQILASDDPSVLAYVRASDDETYVAAIGMDEEAPHTATLADANLPGDAQRLFGEGTLVRDGAAAKLTVPAAGMVLFRVR